MKAPLLIVQNVYKLKQSCQMSFFFLKSKQFGRLSMKCFIVSDAMDQLEQRVSEFFMNAKKNKPEWREEQMASIKKVSVMPWIIGSHIGTL